MDRRGSVTYVELLIVAAIMAGLVGGIVVVLTNTGNNVWARTDSRLASLTQAQAALDRLSDELRRACQSTLAFGVNQVSFKRSPSCQSADPTIIYTLSGSDLSRQDSSTLDATRTVTGGVTAFSPTRLPDNVVRIQLTARGSARTGMPTQTLQSEVRVLNP